MTLNVNIENDCQNSQWPDHMKAVEFELALGSEDICTDSFEACVEKAAKNAGFTLLFNLPSPVDNPVQRIAALGAIDDGQPVFVFVGLHKHGSRAIVHPDLDDMPHIQPFAEALFDLLAD